MKKIRILLIALIIVLGALFYNQTYAAGETRSLGASLERPFNNTKSKYEFRSGANGIDKVYTVVKIYDNEYKDEQGNLLYSKALYCLRGGLGFGADNETDVSKDPISYTEIGEMHKDATSIIAKYKEYYNVDLNRTETINGKEINIYNAILWILDEAYLPVNSTNYDEAEYKEELLTKVGIPKVSQEDITKDDLEVIQQLAIWYFANYDEQKNGDLQSVSVATKFPAQFLSINGNNNMDSRREENLNKIYQYFIYNAIDNAYRYQGTDERNKYVGKNEFDKDLKLQIKSVDYEETIPDISHPELYYYQIGPFKVKNNIDEGTARDTLDLSNIILYDANGNSVKRFYEIPVESDENTEITSGGLQKVYTFVNSNGVEVTELEKGMEYYIRFKKVFEKGFELENVETPISEEEKYDMSSVTLEIASSYSLSTAKFLIRENADQPVVEINKEKISESDKITTEVQKEFDLSLRKYITEVNGVEVPISREPEVDTTELINGTSTSAKYNHKKDPIQVKKGDIVTYTIRIYNEGTVDGIPAEVTEYIPTYFDFDPNDEINKKYGWELIDNYDNNGVGLLKTTYYKDTVLKAFSYQERAELDNTSNYAEGDLKINFIVNDTATEDIVMTNTAEISKYQYADKTPAIDRDSGEQWDIDVLEYGLKLLNDALYENYVVTGKMTQDKADEISDYVKNIMNDYEPDYTSEDYGISSYLDSKGITGEKFIEDAPEGIPEEILTEAYKVINNKNSNKEITEAYAEYIEKFFQSYKGIKENKDDLSDNGYYYKGQEDDDDFEKIILKPKQFDLSLRKFITSIKRNGEKVEFDNRTPSINTETLINGTFDRNGTKEYTATYEHSKEPLTVKKGDIITYTLRIYNEGEIDGYATEITDYIPEGLALILNYNTNFDNGWKLPENLDSSKIIKLVGEDGFYKTEEDVKNLKLEDFSNITSLKDVQLITGKVSITTNELNGQLLKAFDKNKTDAEDGWQKADKGDGGLYYKDVQVSCLVVAENTYKDVITNVAEISEDKDKDGKDVTDRDSTPDNKQDPYTTWQEDDDDYEPVVLKYFDLALRKFITGVETNGKTENVTSRIPVPKIGDDGNIVYEHSKEPVYVANNDTVIYTIRVYNEGTIAGYAEEITDDIPEGLEYLPEHDINKQYEWIMIDKDGNKTENIKEAVKITTDYLSSEKESESSGETTETRDNLIDQFDSSKPISTETPLNPDYKDVKVAFKVTEPNTSDRIIINSAQISEDSDDDEDSIPDEWNDGEDDQDKEYIYVKYFDLSLLKWVTKTIVTVDGKTTTTETGFKPNTGKTETTGIRNNNEAEPIAKVEVDRKKLSSTTVKFVYKIRVTNEGEIEGYATEITDFIPEGLEFKEEDNKAYGWVKEGDNKVTTRALETKLLKPGESAEVEIVFTWKNDTNNLGLKTNIAEITEDYNEHNSKDIDSTPDNKKDPYEKEQEDDDDFALVILSIKTGKGASYALFITAMLVLLTTGIYLVKKYVLTY